MKKRKRLSQNRVDKKVIELENKWKRALADYANLEKRVKKESTVFGKLANAQLLDKILPVLDELEICTQHLKDEGLKIVLLKFREVLKSEGLEEFETEGKEFDPETMDAVEIVKGTKNKVVEVVLRGYRLNDKILRPAKVKVGNGRK